jgi:N-acetylglucosaminyldiphosphoundecaprenol N-acetyl-beta-D-mannosaminyltransferase
MRRDRDIRTRRRGNAETVSTHPRAAAFQIAGIAVDDLTEDETVAAIDELLVDGEPHYMCVVNAAKVVAASRAEELRRVIMGADIITADGMSVVWASRLLGQPLRERVTGIDLFERLVEHAARRGLSVYFLGAREPSVTGLVERFTAKHPDLQVAGYRDGYFKAEETEQVVEEIRGSQASMLFIALGSPDQEYWISENLARTGVRFALGVGGSFDHLSGHARRAPLWMQNSGLEWLYRLLSDPRRLWRRYLIGNPLFIWLVAKQALMGKKQRR